MSRKQNAPKNKGLVLFGRMIIIVAVLQLLVGFFYLLSAFVAVKTGNLPLGWIGNIDFIYTFSYTYIIYGILELIGGIGVLNLSGVARDLLIVTTGIKTFNVFVNSFKLAYTGYTVNLYSIIFLLYLLFVIFFLINKRQYFAKKSLKQ